VPRRPGRTANRNGAKVPIIDALAKCADSRDRSHAYVVWNGTRSPDRVSVVLIEAVTQSHALPH